MNIRKRGGKILVRRNGVEVLAEKAKDTFGFRVVSEEELVETFTRSPEEGRRKFGTMWELRRLKRQLRGGRKLR